MIKLDVGTVGFSVAIVTLALCFVIPRERSGGTSEARFWFFLASCACYGMGLLVIIHRGLIPPGWAVLGGNFLVIVAAVALHVAISTILGRPRMARFYGALLATYLLFQSYYLFVQDDINARIAVIALVRLPLFAHLAYCLHQARRTRPSLEHVLNDVNGIIQVGQHEAGKGQIVQSGQGFGQTFVITGQTTKAGGPTKAAFNHPAAR